MTHVRVHLVIKFVYNFMGFGRFIWKNLQDSCVYQVKALGENWVLLKRDEKQVFRHPSLSLFAVITLAKFLGGCNPYMYPDCHILYR